MFFLFLDSSVAQHTDLLRMSTANGDHVTRIHLLHECSLTLLIRYLRLSKLHLLCHLINTLHVQLNHRALELWLRLAWQGLHLTTCRCHLVNQIQSRVLIIHWKVSGLVGRDHGPTRHDQVAIERDRY
jgi:hypothetical protein